MVTYRHTQVRHENHVTLTPGIPQRGLARRRCRAGKPGTHLRQDTSPPHAPQSHHCPREWTTGRGCLSRRGLFREKPLVPTASSPPGDPTAPRPAMAARCPSQLPARAPYLRRRCEAAPFPRSRGAALAESRRTRHGLLGPDIPPHPALLRVASRTPHCASASPYLRRGMCPPAGSCAQAPHGYRAGRQQ